MFPLLSCYAHLARKRQEKASINIINTWKSYQAHDHPCHCWFTTMALSAPKTVPTVLFSKQPEDLSALYLVINKVLWCQQLIGSAAFRLLARAYIVTTIVAMACLWLSKTIVCRSLIAFQNLVPRTLELIGRLSWALWDCKQSRRLRKRFEFEFFALLLGPSGNALILMLFWPGWYILAFLCWIIRHFAE